MGREVSSCPNLKNMEYRLKHKYAQQLQSNESIEADRTLLKRFLPNSNLLNRSIIMRNGESLSFEIIFMLLDYVSPEDILANRQAISSIKVINNPSLSDKKKDLLKTKSFQRFSGIISQILSFKKQS